MSQLRAGAARSNITPALGCHIAGYLNDRVATDIGDELHARSLVLENDETALAFCVLDLIVATREDLAQAKARAAELTGIPVDSIFICCTHTHYAPSPVGLFAVPREDAYVDWAMQRLGDSVKLAQNRLRPAEVGHASGFCPEETHNRRWHMKDGTVRMNPGHQHPDLVRPAGPTDPEIGLLVVRDLDANPLAAIANYSLHYVGGGDPNAISADYFAYFDYALQRMAGADFVAFMANGFCGDINNIDYSRPAPPPSTIPYHQVKRVANRLAAVAYGAWQSIREYDAAPVLGCAQVEQPVYRRQPSAEELAAAKALYESKEDWADVEWLYAREVCLVAEEPLEQVVPVMGLRVGDLGMVGLPAEVFVAYALRIKEQSPFARTFTIELANDYAGYWPTDQALAEGSYETRLARHAKAAAGTEGRFVQAAVDVLTQLST